jgi:tripartite-type tricarboxylate transporter receptor subunit TctC
MLRIGSRLALVSALMGACAIVPARAADVYAGKTIDIIVGGAAGGGIDLYARLAARRINAHIAGNPNVVVKNMPGAGGTRSMQYVGAVAPADGMTIGATAPGAIVGPLLGEPSDASIDASKFIYIGTTNVGVSICTTMDRSAVKTFQDAQKRESTMGAQGPGAPSFDIALMVKNLAGAKFNVIPGYNGSTHITLAMERGEVDGVCGWNWSGARAQKPDWIRDKRLNLLAQVGIDEMPELTEMGVPPIWNFIEGEDNRKVAKFMLTQKGFERPLFVRDGTPADRVQILRAAFDATMKDANFLADAEKAQLEVSPAPGTRVQELVQGFYNTPKDIVEKARLAVKP